MGFTVLLTACIIFSYSDRKVPIYARLLVFLSMLCSFLCFVILPIDIYQTAEDWQSKDQSTSNSHLKRVWMAIYYINFFLCWLVLPFAQEY